MYYMEYSYEFFLWDLLKNEGWSTRCSTDSHIFQNVYQNIYALGVKKNEIISNGKTIM